MQEKLSYISGKLNLDFHHNVDILVCPTDEVFSASGGLDFAIRKAAGIRLSENLHGKRLPIGQTFVTPGYDLPIKYIIHVSIPRYKEGVDATNTLRQCYENIFSEMDRLGKKEKLHHAQMTVLGTGSNGWSKNKSLEILWEASNHIKSFSLESIYVFVDTKMIESKASIQQRYELFKSGIDNSLVGKTIQFGTFPSELGGSKILWDVLSVFDGKVLLLARESIMQSSYCDYDHIKEDLRNMEWQRCEARKNLNFFVDIAFSNMERTLLYPVFTEDYSDDGPVKDYAFLLTEEEVAMLIPDSEKRCAKINMSIQRSTLYDNWDTKDYKIPWWVLPQFSEYAHVSQSNTGKGYYGIERYPKAVHLDGSFYWHGRNVYHRDFALRPAILLDLDGYNKYHIELEKRFNAR